MQVIVTGLTLVQGVRQKEVNYVGTLESDGYIYFNDDISYRVPTPSRISEDTKPALNGVQIYYPSRKCWIRANYFIGLTAYFFNIENVYDRLDSLETRVSNLENRVSSLEERMTAAELRLSECEERLTDAELRISECENRLDSLETRMTDAENYISQVDNDLQDLTLDLGDFMQDLVLPDNFSTLSQWLANFESRFQVVENYLGRFYEYLSLYSYDSSESNLQYGSLASWMSAVKDMLRLSSRAERTNANNINSLQITVRGNTTAINNTNNRLNNIVISGFSDSMEGWLTSTKDTIDDIDTLLGNIRSNVFNSTVYNPSGATSLDMWMRKTRVDLNDALHDLSQFDQSGTTIYPSGSIAEALVTFIQDLHSLRTDLFGSAGHFVDIANTFTEIRQKALGNNYHGSIGNGVILRLVINTLNDTIDHVNGTTAGTIPSLIVTPWET